MRRALEDVRTQRANRRISDGREPLVALVGYTNAGKSSLLNRLTSGKDAFVADQPFATLDPMVRRAWVAQDQTIRLADTVGFITKLPEELVNAFRATLEELESASLLVHVIDASNPDWQRQKKAVEATLDELGLSEKPVLAVYNKVDRTPRDVPKDALRVSALTGDGIRNCAPRSPSACLSVNAVGSCLALLALCACARPSANGDLEALYRRMHPSVVFLTMKAPSDDPKMHGKIDDAYGSAFVVASGDWGTRIITAKHVIDAAHNLRAHIGDMARGQAVRIIAQDDREDLALLEVSAVKNAGVVELGDSALGRSRRSSRFARLSDTGCFYR